MTAIYRTILREESIDMGYTSILSATFSILLTLDVAQFATLPFTTSMLAERFEAGQRSRRGFSGICRLKPPTRLVTTQFQSRWGDRKKREKRNKRVKKGNGKREHAARCARETERARARARGKALPFVLRISKRMEASIICTR